MMRVDSRLRITFWAVPAFMRVEPATTSTPVSARIGCEQTARMGASALLEMPMVCAPRGARLLESRDGEGRPAARRHADHHVVGSDLRIADARDPLLDGILGVLDRLQQRPFAAGDQVDELVVRPVEGRGQFGAVLHADPARRAGPHIDEAPAAPKARHRFLGGRRDRGKRRLAPPRRR